MKPGQSSLMLASLALGVIIGFLWAEHTSNNRYIRALAEKHEATAKYWDVRTNDIISNNTLERNRRDGKKAD